MATPAFKAKYGRNWRDMGLGLGYFGDRREEEEPEQLDDSVSTHSGPIAGQHHAQVHRAYLSSHNWQFVNNSSSDNSGENGMDPGGNFVPEIDDGNV